MNVNDKPAASRQFVAQPPFWGSKMASRTTPAWQKNPGKSYATMVAVCFAIAIVLGVLFVGMQSLLPKDSVALEYAGRSFHLVGLVVLFGGARLVLVVSAPKDHHFRHERRPDCR
jgi:prolipoprotein diacylglyceryltransferase